MVISGAIVDKLFLAVENNSKYQSGGSFIFRKKLTNFCYVKIKDAQIQKKIIPDCIIDSFLLLYNSVMFAELSKLMGIMITGYGSLQNKTDSIEVFFCMDLKTNFFINF